MPDLAAWRTRQVEALMALGDDPIDAERFVAKVLELSPEDPAKLPADPEAFALAMAAVTAEDVRDARADWMVRVRPEWKRLLEAQVKEQEPS